MPQAKGALSKLLLDFEAVYGTTPGTPNGRNMPFYSCGLKAGQKLNDDELIRGVRSIAPPTVGNQDVSGPLSVPIDKRSIGWWLTAMFGNPVTTGASAPYTHVWKVGASQPSFVLEKGFYDINQFFLYNGCKIAKAGFEFGGDGDQKMSLDVMGSKETLGVASFDITPTEIVLDKFGAFQLAMTEGGVAIATINKAKLDLDFGLDGDRYPIGCGGNRTDILEGIVNPSGDIEAFFMDAALLNKAINGTETSLSWKWTSGAHSLEILLSELRLVRNSPEISGRGGVSVNLDFRAYYQDHADATAVKVTLINDTASYAK